MKFHINGRRWAREFLIGRYRGPAVDYLMAIVIVWAMMVVTLVALIRTLLGL
jgi:hypothetical protein